MIRTELKANECTGYVGLTHTGSFQRSKEKNRITTGNRDGFQKEIGIGYYCKVTQFPQICKFTPEFFPFAWIWILL